MRDFAARPWGRLAWVIERLDTAKWSFYGCVSTEERWSGALELLVEGGRVDAVHLVEIAAPPGHPKQELFSALKGVQEDKAQTLAPDSRIEHHDLLERYELIVESANRFAECAEDVVFDITALPKRFFFPMLRCMLKSDNVRNIIVTYTVAEEYAGEALHEDAEPPVHLPLFAAQGIDELQALDLLLVGLGFDAPGLMQIVEMGEFGHVEVMLPYPAAPPFGKRNWDFLRHIDGSIDRNHLKLVETSSIDVPSCHAAICAATAMGEKRAVIAPYGPKPLSLAMCLYALGVGREASEVIYTQPKYYHPRYSTGIRHDADGDIIYAYPVRLAGRDLYSASQGHEV